MAHTKTMVVQGIDLVGPTTAMTYAANKWYGPHQDHGGAVSNPNYFVDDQYVLCMPTLL